MNFVAIDFETANRWRQSACSIGIAVVENGKVVKSVHKYIKPTPNYYEGINISVHGITASDTDDQPTWEEQWDEIRPYLENRVVIAHNASFDMSVLRKLCDEYQLEYPNIKYYCSMLISRRMFEYLPNHKLSTVSGHFGFELDHHHAESDAIACAKIMQQIISEQAFVDTFDQLDEKISVKAGEIYPGGYKAFKSNTASRKKKTSYF